MEWLSAEEGRILFSEERTPFLTVDFYITGKEEAELQLQDVVFPDEMTESDEKYKKIISKMTKCISQSFRLLWEEGYEETILVEQRGTKNAKIIDSTGVVHVVYSEYMMKCCFEPQKTTGCGQTSVKLTKTEDGFFCENEDRTFFCRLMRYNGEKAEENHFYLYEVEVKKRQRNQGIATACLITLFGQLSEEAPVTVSLQVGSYNEPAVHLYKKLGFKVTEELCCYAPED